MAQEVEIAVKPIFFTPLFVVTVPDADRLNVELRKAILEREATAPAYTDHEVVGWSSPHDLSMLQWAGAPLQRLFEFVVGVAEQLTEFTQHPSNQPARPHWQVAETWANVQRAGGSNAAHPHPGSFWSAVYYVDVGDIVTNPGCGGELQLFDPRGCLPRMLAPYLRYTMPELHDAGSSISYQPEAGQCVLFPGWLSHAVARYTGQKPRISVAFNLDPLLK
ncbi:MAG TPA: 2OG-Fe(II) oxygenase family protein [Nitrospirales bacterium]|nr:2OG-Fe(II) oxygenase family protein [Nitrospirales bacterium]